MSSAEEEYYLSWLGKVSGPFALGQIQDQLRSRKINSLYKVQVDGEWRLLRDFLKQSRQRSQLEEEKEEVNPSPPEQVTSQPGARRAVRPELAETILAEEFSYNVATSEELDGPVGTGPKSRGFGITSFILSLCFFIPVLNIFTLIIAVVFGHIALGDRLSPRRSRGCSLAWFGLWTSYVHGGFLLIAYGYAAVLSITNKLYDGVLFEIHMLMFANAVFACIGGGLIMAAVRMLASYSPPFYVAYVASLIPVSISQVVSLVLVGSLHVEDDLTRALWTFAIVQGVMFVLQTLLWASMITGPSGKPLGHLHSAVTSLFYSFVSVFLSLGLVVLLTLLATSIE